MKTGDLQSLLGVSDTTVRKWTQEFSDYLSDSAKAIGSRQRSFTEDDVVIMQTIASLSNDGHSYAEIRLRLEAGERIDELGMANAGISSRLVPEASVRTIIDSAEIRAERDRLVMVVHDQQNRISELEAQLRNLHEQAAKERDELLRELKDEVATARERAARAEAQAEMLKDLLKNDKD